MGQIEEKYKDLKGLLGKFSTPDVNRFAAYCNAGEIETKTDGSKKNPHFQKLSAGKLAEMYRRVDSEGLLFDGRHVTITYQGINYDYVAYKNKMYIAYPESKLDVQLVYEGDVFKFEKVDGSVNYSHKLKDPFNNDEGKIIGGYCVIKNKRGEFLTTLTKADFLKHRGVAKTKRIWDAWYTEMCLKTLFRKGIKVHFEDIYSNMNEDDNLNFDLNKEVVIDSGSFSDAHRKHMDNADTLDELEMYADGVPELINNGEFQAYYSQTINRIKGQI